MDDSLIKLIFSFNDLETKYQYKFLNRKWKKLVELCNIDRFSHLFKDVFNIGNLDSNKKITNNKYFFTKPHDIIDVADGLELLFLQVVPRVNFIKTYDSKNISRSADLLHGFIMPSNGISKVIFSVSGSYYNIYDYKINNSRLIQYGRDAVENFCRGVESKVEWINPFTQPVNIAAAVYQHLDLEVYDKNGERYKSIDLIYSYVDCHERKKLFNLPIGKFYNINEYDNRYYFEGDIISSTNSEFIPRKQINLKLINKLCRNRYNRKREILRKYLYKNLLNIVLSY